MGHHELQTLFFLAFHVVQDQQKNDFHIQTQFCTMAP